MNEPVNKPVNIAEWLGTVFPEVFSDDAFDISKLLQGFDDYMEREMADGRIPSKWTDTELQWDPICNALFEHYSQTQTETLAWMMLKMTSDRVHGQWRIQGNGGRRVKLDEWQNRRNWLFALKARLGVVDGWIRQNDSGASYSRFLFEGLSNPIVLLISPRAIVWEEDSVYGRTEPNLKVYQKIIEVLELPISTEWLVSMEDLLKVRMFSREGQETVCNLDQVWSTLSKKQLKYWSDTNPKAVQNLLSHLQYQVHQAHCINRCLTG